MNRGTLAVVQDTHSSTIAEVMVNLWCYDVGVERTPGSVSLTLDWKHTV